MLNTNNPCAIKCSTTPSITAGETWSGDGLVSALGEYDFVSGVDAQGKPPYAGYGNAESPTVYVIRQGNNTVLWGVVVMISSIKALFN